MATNPEFQSHVRPEEKLHEFTFTALLTGTILGLIFAASSLYLVLKVGITVSASIPVSVLAITLFRGFNRILRLRKATILENNITQTAGSAGESIAFGVGVTMPALLLLGFPLSWDRVMIVSVLGGLLGILAMIPLRRAFIVKMHGKPGTPNTLLYPEGTACAQVLKSGESGATTGKVVFLGFFLAFIQKFFTEGLLILKGTFALPIVAINRAAVFAADMAPELMGVGYIIGIRTSAIMMGGAVLGYLIIIPLIYLIGEHAGEAIKPSDKLIKDMSIGQIRNSYLLFIGAGCVATAGIISMLRTLPMILHGLISMFKKSESKEVTSEKKRTDDDLPMSVVILGSLGLIGLFILFLSQEVGWQIALGGGCLIVLFGFLFVTVSARLTGEIGSTSNPISGMTVATLLLTCLIFASLGLTSPTERVLALSVAAVVCVASSNGGTTAQSLKTGFLLGATPRKAQYAILIGALVSALVIGGMLILFNQSKMIYSQKPENVPNVQLTSEELDKLSQEETYQGVKYRVLDTRNEEINNEELNKKGIKTGRYLVESQTGKLKYYIDYTIMGKLTQTDDGTPVSREFEAPKTQVMGLIINGVLRGDLNWSMVSLGALIALMLELCGISALAFAVGVYVPIQYSAPIFMGGIIRYLIERRHESKNKLEIESAQGDPEKLAQIEVDAIRRAETSSGVLLASGYIAGGSLAGVLISFFAFSDTLPGDLATWQYRTTPIVEQQSFDSALQKITSDQIGIDGQSLHRKKEVEKKELDPGEKKALQKYDEYLDELKSINKDLPLRNISLVPGTILQLPSQETYTPEKNITLANIAQEKFGNQKPLQSVIIDKIWDINSAVLTIKDKEDKANVQVPSGQTIRIPAQVKIDTETSLGQIAEQTLGRARKANILYELNKSILKPNLLLSPGTELQLPRPDWIAYSAFGILGLILLWMGWKRN